MKGKKTGGRQKGTPNKPNPLKGLLRAHSEAYFTPRRQTYKDDDGKQHTKTISDFDRDLELLAPDDRVNAELRMLEFHMPKMKSVDVDMTHELRLTIEDRLRQLCTDDEDEGE